jgi:hypothetical protein
MHSLTACTASNPQSFPLAQTQQHPQQTQHAATQQAQPHSKHPAKHHNSTKTSNKVTKTMKETSDARRPCDWVIVAWNSGKLTDAYVNDVALPGRKRPKTWR